jgi:prepilin-type processing-associated H-X9-DG protein
MGLALQLYHDTFGALPVGYNTANITGWGGANEIANRTTWETTGWTIALLPYLEQKDAYNQELAYVTANPGRGGIFGAPVYGLPMKVYTCPSNPRPLVAWDGVATVTSYLGNAGTVSGLPTPSQDGVLYAVTPGNPPVKIHTIADGSSNTIAIGERPCTPDLSWGWAFGAVGVAEASSWPNIHCAYGDGDIILGSNDVSMILFDGLNGCTDPPTMIGFQPPRDPNGRLGGEDDIAHFWSFHTNGANFLFCDGHVQFVSYSAGRSVFPAMCTRSGDEVFEMP